MLQLAAMLPAPPKAVSAGRIYAGFFIILCLTHQAFTILLDPTDFDD